MTLEERLEQLFPKEMAEFVKAPWNYTIFAPCSMDDELCITVYLEIGKRKCTKKYKLEINGV